MIDIITALQNILKAVYGRDVRQSIHDAIYQINANANEAIDLAQIKFGTAVSSPTDPIAGFTENTLYLNINTNIMWKLEGGSWTKKGTFKSIDSISLASTSGSIDTYTITFTDESTSNFNVKNGADGIDGKSITGITKTSTSGKIDHYDINLSDGTTISGFDVTNGSDGADGKSIANISLASTSGNVKTYDVLLDDGTKTPTGFSVEDGASSYLHIRYSSSFDGTGMVTTPTDATVYIGILVSTSSVAPTNPSLYNWVRFIGKSGTGSGDMLSTDYATKYPNTVDKAAALYDGTDEILANQLMKKSQYDADGDGVVDLAKAANKALLANNAELADNAMHALMSEKAWGLESSDGTYKVSAKEAKDMYNCFHKEGTDLKLSDNALSSATTTKLSKVDTTDNLSVELAKKIDKPASATDGQVLTYNATSNKWEAQDSKGGGADTSIISDAYDESKSYVAGEYCIYDNALWKALGNSQGTTPTEGTLWTKVSVSEELEKINSSLVKYKAYNGTMPNYNKDIGIHDNEIDVTKIISWMLYVEVNGVYYYTGYRQEFFNVNSEDNIMYLYSKTESVSNKPYKLVIGYYN